MCRGLDNQKYYVLIQKKKEPPPPKKKKKNSIGDSLYDITIQKEEPPKKSLGDY